MLVWEGGQSGTIGGGALEFQARAERHRDRLDRVPLGPALGQCCGGAVTLLTEVSREVPEGEVFARPLPGTSRSRCRCRSNACSMRRGTARC